MSYRIVVKCMLEDDEYQGLCGDVVDYSITSGEVSWQDVQSDSFVDVKFSDDEIFSILAVDLELVSVHVD